MLVDLNVNMLDNTSKTNRVKKVCNPLSLTQLITRSTQVAKKASTLINHIYTNRVDHCVSPALLDHNPIFTIRKKNVKRETCHEKIIEYRYSLYLLPKNYSTIKKC